VPERTAEEWREQTEEARRAARYRFASDRIRKIVDGMPPLTGEQRSKLALLLQTGTAELAARPAEARRDGDTA
jgi:hypothetical protein